MLFNDFNSTTVTCAPTYRSFLASVAVASDADPSRLKQQTCQFKFLWSDRVSIDSEEADERNHKEVMKHLYRTNREEIDKLLDSINNEFYDN